MLENYYVWVMMVNGGRMTEVIIQNKPVTLRISKKAQKVLEQRDRQLFVEMELYFSCLIRKQVLFHDIQRQADSVRVDDKLSVSFHPVMTASCMIKDAEPEPVKSDFEIQRRESFIPKWLTIDFKKGSFSGEFGY